MDTAQGHIWRWLVLTRVCQELLQVLADISLHPADLHWSQGDSTGVRLTAAAVLSRLVQCEQGSCILKELLCTRNLTRTPGWPVTWFGLAAPRWGKEGEATPAWQRDWVGEPRSCVWRDPAMPGVGQSLSQQFQDWNSLKPYTPLDLPTHFLL